MRTRGFAVLLFALLTSVSHAAEVLHPDLSVQMRDASQNPSSFAVSLKHDVDTESGQWTSAAGVSVWRYDVSVPDALSLSFHARSLNLPKGAVLEQTSAGGVTFRYTAADLAGDQLWSRISQGDSLHLTLSVPTADKAAARLSIDELQVGFRSLSEPGKVHPALRKDAARATPQATATSSCDENYQCNITAANTAPAAATLAITVNNTNECSATLVNDTSNDYRPFVLTARHCQYNAQRVRNNDASGVVFYWRALSACGQPLDTIYNTAVATTTGGVTRSAVQDAWLIEANSPPPAAAQAYYAGWDSTGGTIVGGYGIHHGANLSKQYVEYYGQAIVQAQTDTNDGGSYSTNYISVSNSKGRDVSGSSGSGLFDSNNRVVGVLTGGNGACPANPPQPPTSTSASSIYTQLAGAYADTTDTTSTTPSIQSFLDAAKTGLQVAPSIPAPQPPAITISASTSSATVGAPVTISWSTTDATSCSGAGGQSGDGWSSASAPISGSKQVTESAAGTYTYTLQCVGGGGTASNSVSVSFSSPAPAPAPSPSPSPTPAPSSGGSSGSSGGGSFGLPFLIAGFTCVLFRRRRTS